jgi:catechol 2,3-dioxygenase-like lactoylglutathione lyase family enzyme
MDTVTTSPAIGGIGQIAINARDIERAVAFYRDSLGLRFLFQVPGLAFFDCGGIRLMLSGADSPEFDHASSVLYFRVGDIAAAHEAMAARGVAFRDAPHKIADMPDHELWMTFFDDSEGNVLALMAELPRHA